MKKLLAIVLALALCLGMVTMATAETTKYKIGVLVPAVTHGWVGGITYNAEQYCKELEAAGTIEYKLLTSSNAEEMTAQFDEVILWGAQAIVVAPQWTGMEVAAQNAIDQGITVVALPVPTSGSVSELRMKGFTDTMAEIAPDVEIIEYATAFTREDGLKDMADILTANPQIDAVYSLDDETSIGALQAIEDAGRTDIKAITGGGGCQEYFNIIKEKADEIHACSALYSPLMIKDCLDVALSVLGGETVDAVKVIPSQIVDATNVDEYIDPSNTIY